MKYIINENQLHKFVSKFIGDLLGGLKEIDNTSTHYIKYFVNEDNQVVFYYATDSGNLYIKSKKIKDHLFYLEDVFGFGWFETKKILEKWFLDNYGIKVHKIY